MKTIPEPPNNGTLCQVSREHVLSIRTARGAWTRKQLEALGVPWPPKRGWLEAWTEPRTIALSDWDRAAGDANLVVNIQAKELTSQRRIEKATVRYERAEYLALKAETHDALGLDEAMSRWDV